MIALPNLRIVSHLEGLFSLVLKLFSLFHLGVSISPHRFPRHYSVQTNKTPRKDKKEESRHR